MKLFDILGVLFWFSSKLKTSFKHRPQNESVCEFELVYCMVSLSGATRTNDNRMCCTGKEEDISQPLTFAAEPFAARAHAVVPAGALQHHLHPRSVAASVQRAVVQGGDRV